MNISILCSAKSHPIYDHLAKWAADKAAENQVIIVNAVSELPGGDILLLISCNEIVSAETRAKYRHALVVHASALPEGRGWSPHVWQILEGKNTIPVTLLEARDQVDTGPIWAQETMQFDGHELYDEINERLFNVTLRLMDFALEKADIVQPIDQAKDKSSTYYSKRKPGDSRLDPHKTIAEQFDLLRVADAQRFPCFFEYRGKRYRVFLAKENDL